MRFAAMFLAAAGLICAQSGQSPPRPGWPCTPGTPVDPSYLNASESTGGQLFMFQRNEVAQSVQVMTASNRYKATILRVVGNLSGSREFEFPVDSTVSGLLVMASIQCRNSVLISRPNGAEFTAAESASNIDLHSGRIVGIDRPEPGAWRVRLAGTGLFLLSVLAKTDIALGAVTFANGRRSPLLGVQQTLDAHVSGAVSALKLQLVDAAGNPLVEPMEIETIAEGAYRATIAPSTERLRILVTGVDASGLPFQRMYPILFKAEPAH